MPRAPPVTITVLLSKRFMTFSLFDLFLIDRSQLLKDAPDHQVSYVERTVVATPSCGALAVQPQFIDGGLGPHQTLGSEWNEIAHRRVAVSHRQFGGDELRFEAG